MQAKLRWFAAASLLCLAAPLAAQDASAAEAGAPVTQFDVNAFEIIDNTLLPAEDVEDIVYPFTGPDRTADDIEQARAALQKAYEDRGYATVSVFIPEQSIEGGIIRLEVQPQTIGTVEIAGAERTTREWIMERAPSLTPGKAPNFTYFQRDVVALNQSADRKITPEVKAGVAPGTVDVVLNVEDRSPIHGSVELNNFSSAATTDLRAAATLRHDDLWGRGDSLTLSAQVAPRRPDDALVFSGSYLMRLGGVQLLLSYLHSDSDISVIGGTNVVGQGDIAGLRLVVPTGQAENFYHQLTAGFDFKSFGEDIALGADTDSAPITYVPFTVSWRGDWTGERVQANIGLSSVFAFRGLGDGDAAFDYKRFNARPSFFIVKLDGGAAVPIIAGLQLGLDGSAQWSPDPLISNEGFSLGGFRSVRGYFESESIGDWGASLQAELRLVDLASGIGAPLDELQLHAFADAGIAGIYDALPGQVPRYEFLSLGAGLRAKMFGYFSGAIDVGVPLAAGSDTDTGDIVAKFRILGEF